MTPAWFSSRTHWDLRPNALSELLFRKRREKAEVLDLTESNPTQAGFAYPVREILGALASPEALVYQPDPRGLQKTREAISASFADSGFPVPADRILATASTSDAYAYLFKLLADPGDEILVPRPSYPLFEYLASLESLRVVHYPLAYDEGWWLDVDALPALAGPRTRAVVVVNPNNPTGSYLKRGELEALTRFCGERNLAVISDEVFSDFALRSDPQRVASLAARQDGLTFSLSGLSKIAGLPQLKLAWVAVSGSEDLRHEAMARLELIADTYLSTGSPVQHAAVKLLPLRRELQRQMIERLQSNLAHLRGALAEQSCFRLLDLEGGWYATLRLPPAWLEEEWTLSLLEEHDVLVQPGYFYDFPAGAFVVLSLLAKPEVFREGVRRCLLHASPTA